eukprot:scaffold10576_cov115-Isochrysis_galbana.AAC.2
MAPARPCGAKLPPLPQTTATTRRYAADTGAFRHRHGRPLAAPAFSASTSLRSQNPSGASASAEVWTERKWRPVVRPLPSSKSWASRFCSGVRIRANRYCVSSPTSSISSRLSSTAFTNAKSTPVSQAAMAEARWEKTTNPGTIASSGGACGPDGSGHKAPKPMLSAVMPPPGRNSAYGSVTNAYCSPRGAAAARAAAGGSRPSAGRWSARALTASCIVCRLSGRACTAWRLALTEQCVDERLHALPELTRVDAVGRDRLGVVEGACGRRVRSVGERGPTSATARRTDDRRVSHQARRAAQNGGRSGSGSGRRTAAGRVGDQKLPELLPVGPLHRARVEIELPLAARGRARRHHRDGRPAARRCADARRARLLLEDGVTRPAAAPHPLRLHGQAPPRRRGERTAQQQQRHVHR